MYPQLQHVHVLSRAAFGWALFTPSMEYILCGARQGVSCIMCEIWDKVTCPDPISMLCGSCWELLRCIMHYQIPVH
jgi:hypothetical protein